MKLDKIILKISVLTILLLIGSPVTNSYNVYQSLDNSSYDISENKTSERIINIAQYPRLSNSDELFDIIFNYTWMADNTLYKFTIKELTLDEVAGFGDKPLNTDNYDLIVVGANYNSYIKDCVNNKVQENIKEFLSDGGGYIGSCAGATLASMGFEKSNGLFHRFANRGVLKIANVYSNEDWFGELQYCLRSATHLPPIELSVNKTTSNPIFAPYPTDSINLTYGGGPGLYLANFSDPKLGEIVPLLTYSEDLMETKPIYWYIKGLLPGWIPIKKVEVDILGQYCAIATTYNNSGKIVLYSSHAEIPLMINGTISERFGRPPSYASFGLLPRIVYDWSGTPMNMSHNWWILRRTAAWIARVSEEHLPPCNELMVFMDKPQFRLGHKFYVNNEIDNSKTAKKMVEEAGMTIIQGNITIEAYAENSDVVEFYVDGVLEYTDTDRPFEWNLDKELKGVHRLELRAYDEHGNCVRDGSEFLFTTLIVSR